jgi:hypothetical protein
MALAKTPTEGKNWLPLLLAATVVLGGLVLWDRQSDDGGQKDRGGIAAPVVAKGARKVPPAQVAARADQSINPLANLGLDKLRDTIGRPLFEKSRRPIAAPAQLAMPKAEPAAPIAARAADQNALSLLGVVTSEERTIALLKRNQTGQSIRAEVGDEVDGWTIVRIEPQRVTLRQGDTQIALRLFRKKLPK